MQSMFRAAFTTAVFFAVGLAPLQAAPRLEPLATAALQVHGIAAKNGNGNSDVLVTSLLLAPGGNKGVGGGVGGGRYCNRSGLGDGSNPGLGDNGPGKGQGAVRSQNPGKNNPSDGGPLVGGGGCPASH